MTRAEQLAQAAARAQEKLDRDKKSLAQVQAQQRSEDRKARNRRRYQIGTMADAAGLCDLDDTTMAGLFTLLTPLTQAMDPVAVLASLLAAPGCLDAEAVDGTGPAAQVSALRTD
jgi:hypothetical protein